MQRGMIELKSGWKPVGLFEVPGDGTVLLDQDVPVQVGGQEVTRVIYPLTEVHRILVLAREPVYGAGMRYDEQAERLFEGHELAGAR